MYFVRLSAIVVVVYSFVLGCSSDKSSSPTDSGSDTGSLKILLTDAPAEFDNVNITFTEVSVHYGNETADEADTTVAKTSGEWIVVNDQTQTFDLLTLSNGVTSLLGEKELVVGRYTQIRLVISDAEVIVDGESFHLKVPSGTFKFVNGFDIEADTPTELVVDFDAARSVHEKGKKGEYSLKPTLRLINKAQAGSISGTVTNYQNLPVAYAIAGVDTLSSSYIKEDSGQFKLAFLPAGTYTVAVADTLGRYFTKADVLVSNGKTTSIGELTLQ